MSTWSRKCPHDHWLANKAYRQYHSNKKILGVLPRRWRRKTAAIDTKQNYVTVATYPVRHRADGHTVTTHVDVHDVDSSHQWQHAQPHHEHEVHHWNSKQVATLTAASGRIAAVPLRIALNISTASKPGHAKVWPPKCPFPPGDSDPPCNTSFLGPTRVHITVASRSVHPFLQGSSTRVSYKQTDTQTDNATPAVYTCSSWPLCYAA